MTRIDLQTVLSRASSLYAERKRAKYNLDPTSPARELASDQIFALAEALVEEINRALAAVGPHHDPALCWPYADESQR